MIQNTIATKIKILGALLVLLMLSIIAVTIFLNEKNAKDALIVNIVGKERMLTQKMSKSIFYNFQSNTKNFNELDGAIAEFVKNIYALRDGDQQREIVPVPTPNISYQLEKVLVLWDKFHIHIQLFKEYSKNNDLQSLQKAKSTMEAIYIDNNILLQEVDNLVSLYTKHYETKTNYIKKFQYGAVFALLLLIVYSLWQLKNIESHAQEFFEKSKKIVLNSLDSPLTPIKIDAEHEIVEATDTINCFINKINTAVTYSQEALNFSKSASSKLEEITDEFGDILKELNNKDITKVLNKSEDIAIESTEELLNSTKKLENLKAELDNLLTNCKNTKINQQE